MTIGGTQLLMGNHTVQKTQSCKMLFERVSIVMMANSSVEAHKQQLLETFVFLGNLLSKVSEKVVCKKSIWF